MGSSLWNNSTKITTIVTFAAITIQYNNRPVDALVTPGDKRSSMWQILDARQPKEAWKVIFGEKGERGEYMDGYSKKAMVERCREDYKWGKRFSPDTFASERANMMSHLYDNDKLWEHVSMVAFAEHYVLTDEEEKAISKPFDTFRRQRNSQPQNQPIFSGVVLSNWKECDENSVKQKIETFKEKGMDYIRLECNFGTVDDIGGSTQLADSSSFSERFQQLAMVANACQKQEMVPLVLLQVPWREPGVSNGYFDQVIKSFANALKNEGVESNQLLLETRPPIGLSSSAEKSLGGSQRISLGLETGRKMFETIEEAFEGKIAGFCVAGGSTKGDFPTAMEDDTQNGVRQGMRSSAQKQWEYEVCFWEMGAKLMLQPKVGRLWKNSQDGRDAARELFCVNAEDMADEIKVGI